ncbi:hypothetical protein [uncultured Ruegeria sp.]|uniref:hypothetical protein n=1 Tax=uncultured Ruegeria sp. TaxID=259304 RepID=UPI00261866F4|nr:hypothetical protein [uncultured Ruegeria sp.]
MRWMLVTFGLVLLFSGPRLGQVFQCYWEISQTVEEDWSTAICGSPAWVDLKFVAPFQLVGALLCILGVWLMKKKNAKVV